MIRTLILKQSGSDRSITATETAILDTYQAVRRYREMENVESLRGYIVRRYTVYRLVTACA